MRIERRDGKRIEIDEEERVFQGFFDVYRARVAFERFDGSMSPPSARLSLERGDSAAALIYESDADRLLFARQFRYPAVARNGPGWLLEIVAGAVDDEEEPAECIRREILEEAGYRVAGVEPVCSFYTSPGGSSERIHLFFAEVSAAEKVAAGGGRATENEDIELVRLSPSEVESAIRDGGIVDGKTLAACWWFLAGRDEIKEPRP